MKSFSTATTFVLMLATLTSAYNPHDPNDPVMFVRRLRAGSKSIKNNNAIEDTAPKKLRPNPNRGRGRGLSHTFPPSGTAGPSALTCANSCGDFAGGCYCDAICHSFGDCCDDVCDECDICESVETTDPSTTIPPTAAPSSTSPPIGTADPSALTCANSCGDVSPGGCYCDPICQNYGDCCDDVCDECGFCEPVETPEPGTAEPASPAPSPAPSPDSTTVGTSFPTASEPCYVCGDSSLSVQPDLTVMIGDEEYACGDLELAGELRLFGDDLCPLVTALVTSDCGCTPGGSTGAPTGQTVAPVTTPVTAPPTEPTGAPTDNAQQLDCSFQGDVDLRGDGSLLLRSVIDPDSETVTIELEYAGEGWVGMAFSEDGQMVPSTAVIGLPDDNTVAKHALTERSAAGVTAIDSSTLTNAAISQANGVTILTFTKPLVEADEPTVVVGDNLIIWAVGQDSGNTLGYHGFDARGSATVAMNECLAPTSV